MKQLILALTLIASSAPSFGAPADDAKLNLRRLTDRIYDEVAVSRVDTEKLQKAEAHLRAALLLLQGQDLPADDYSRNSCLIFMMDRSHSPTVASCKGVKPAHLECINDMLARSYHPSRAREICVR